MAVIKPRDKTSSQWRINSRNLTIKNGVSSLAKVLNPSKIEIPSNVKSKPFQVVDSIKKNQNGWRARGRNLILKHEVKNFTKEFRTNFITLIISSFGLVVALTWNSFWNAWISALPAENTTAYKFYIAVLMTVAAVIITYIMSKFKG